MINIDLNQIGYDILPPALRTLINFHWVQVILKPLIDNYISFTGYTYDNDFEIYHNSQVLSFEDYLNTKIPSGYSGVTIGNGTWVDETYLWYQTEIDSLLKEVLYVDYSGEGVSPELYLSYQFEYDADTFDFVVYYHAQDLVDNAEYLNELIVWIDKLRIIGTTYKFETI